MQRQKCIYLNNDNLDITTYGATFKQVLLEFIPYSTSLKSMYHSAHLVMLF